MELDLSREDMMKELKKREIHLPDMEGLAQDRLEDIYRRFVVPRPRREREPRDRTAHPHPHPNPIPMEVEHLTQRIRSVAMVGQKRPLQESPSDDSAKQIKMDLR
ncbi:uncharacterized protein LOC108024039 [Drosophila biarmipes]|uniref:uncharacterized protein LOC108024039 n=1 Tax=Drosophila biarmipes TaxID=125945 RepID=UPI0007E5D32E|nr:uncharacterized protein LOC108024039 [Drosophila biarmipes]